jgi:hypothetical protein
MCDETKCDVVNSIYAVCNITQGMQHIMMLSCVMQLSPIIITVIVHNVMLHYVTLNIVTVHSVITTWSAATKYDVVVCDDTRSDRRTSNSS